MFWPAKFDELFRLFFADERTRDIIERRERARRDMASLVDGRAYDVARKLLKMKMPIDQIATATDLTREQIESLLYHLSPCQT